MTETDDECECAACQDHQARTNAWRLQHAPHLGERTGFVTEPFEHWAGPWFWLVCPCGARHLTDS